MINSYLNIFDIIVIITLIIFDIFLYKYNVKWISKLILTIFTISYILIFPYISTKLESYLLMKSDYAESLDGLNFLYIWLKWPFYWFLGTIELLFLIYYKKNPS